MILVKVLQIVVALGLLNVWLLRFNQPTAYRGGNARSLKQEFAVYGLPGWLCYLVGTLKVGGAIFLLIGLWVPALAFWASSVIALLMMGALSMHIKVSDRLQKSLPAAFVLLATLIICAATYRASVA